MPTDIASLLFALTLNMLVMSVALPSVMGEVNTAARRAQAGIFAGAVGWALLLGSGLTDAGSWADRALSTLAMAGIAGGMALNAVAFDLWCGRTTSSRAPAAIAVLLTLGYGIGFSSYAFRVGWANGLLALQMAMVAATLWRKPLVPVGRWRWLLVVALLAQTIVTAWRGVLGAFFTDQFPTFLTLHPVNIAFGLVANVTSMLSLAGILLAHRDEAARGLQLLATLDGLTGVFNRRAWLVQAKLDLAISVRYDQPLVLLMLDLDYFKQINDSHGHEAGDRALRFFAVALQTVSRTGDVLCRYGGEEFCVLMNRADHAATQSFDQRLRALLAASAQEQLGHQLSYSAGVATRVGAGDTLEAMLRRADVALYGAKALGRARTLDAQGRELEPASAS
ncbi:diguanylate cyclase [Janthinobacterium sp. CG_23.3]|uniref:GGDEF domain-containing protein n=1 Tax=Janthinobacterium sp. CG_23.3 TaxID=3349634 RepID=UPI0038D3D95D